MIIVCYLMEGKYVIRDTAAFLGEKFVRSLRLPPKKGGTFPFASCFKKQLCFCPAS